MCVFSIHEVVGAVIQSVIVTCIQSVAIVARAYLLSIALCNNSRSFPSISPTYNPLGTSILRWSGVSSSGPYPRGFFFAPPPLITSETLKNPSLLPVLLKIEFEGVTFRTLTHRSLHPFHLDDAPSLA